MKNSLYAVIGSHEYTKKKEGIEHAWNCPQAMALFCPKSIRLTL